MATMKKAQTGKKLPKAGKQTPADFDPESYDKKYPRTPGGGANYPEPNGKRGVPMGGPAKKPKMKMGGTMKKAKAGFDLNKDGKTTFKDVLIGRGVLPKTAKKGSSMKKAQMGTDMMQSPMMKKGGSVKKCKYGCK